MPEPTNPDRHRNTPVMGRPDAQLRQTATQILERHGWSMNEFVIASLDLLTRNPEATLQCLSDSRPTVRMGRPASARRDQRDEGAPPGDQPGGAQE